jgi:pimeloyl-ACP methyl ester carboxylesterase
MHPTTSETVAARHGAFSITSDDGTTIGYQSWGAGPPLLLVHGCAADRTAWWPVVQALAQHFRVHAMDRRGRGLSGDSDRYALAREAEDVAAVANAVGDRVAVLGHSYGAVCALEAALLTDTIDALVLDEPACATRDHTPVRPATVRILADLLVRGDQDGALEVFLRDVLGFHTAELIAMRAGLTWPARRRGAYPLVRECRAANAYHPEADRLAGVRARARVLLGSGCAPWQRAAAIQTYRALPVSELAPLAGPDALVDSVIGFLRAGGYEPR